MQSRGESSIRDCNETMTADAVQTFKYSAKAVSLSEVHLEPQTSYYVI